MTEPESSRRKIKRTKSNDSLKSSGSSRRLDGSGHESREKTRGAEDYEEALAKVAARFSTNEGRSSGKARRSSHKLQMEGEPAERRSSRTIDSYEQALAKVASRFSAETTRSSGKALSRQSSRDKLPDNYEEALAKVAARFGSSRSSGRAASSRNLMADESAKANRSKSPKRRSSHKQLDDSYDPVEDVKPRRRSSHRQLDETTVHAIEDIKPKRRSSHKQIEDVADRPRRRTSSKLLDDENELIDEVKRRLSESSNHSEQRQKSGKEVVPRKYEYTRQLSDDSMDFDGAIAEAMNAEEDSNHGEQLDEPKRKVERRGSDSSLDKTPNIGGAKRGRERGRGLRRTTSEELHAFEFAERAEADARVRTDPSPKRKPIRKSKGLRVTFIEDPNEKNGIACTYLEGGGPLSPEEKGSAWYGGRNYKLFKSLCYTESVEAKENEDYCTRFEKVWAACATTSVDFAWQELMKAEHKKNSPNNAVMLAKARCRGFEREIFPETLLRNRLATVKYVVRSYRQAMLSMTIEKQDKEAAVREASLRCSQPFRRFARLMAEGDALLVAAWERVKKKDENLDESRRSSAQMERRASRRDLMAEAGRRSSRNLMGTGESRRDLMSSLKSSGSCRKLLSDSDYSNESRRNLLAGSRGSGTSRRNLMSKLDSHRDLLVSLKSSGSSRKLMADYNNRDSRSSDSKRNLMGSSRSESLRNMLSGSKQESRRNMLAGSSSDSKRSLVSKSSSRRMQLDQTLDKFSDEEEEVAPRQARRGSRKLQAH